jgi:glutaredoxin
LGGTAATPITKPWWECPECDYTPDTHKPNLASHIKRLHRDVKDCAPRLAEDQRAAAKLRAAQRRSGCPHKPKPRAKPERHSKADADADTHKEDDGDEEDEEDEEDDDGTNQAPEIFDGQDMERIRAFALASHFAILEVSSPATSLSLLATVTVDGICDR